MLTVYHNPRCSKSRQTLALIDAVGAEYQVHLYLKSPLDADELHTLKKALQLNSFLDMMRPKEADFKTAQLTSASSEIDFVNALVNYPKLLERPIVTNGSQAVIGRPPENVNVLF